MATPSVPERHRLEMSFAKARWLGVGSLTLLTAVADPDHWPLWAVTVLFASGNYLVGNISARLRTLPAQQRLGVAAVVMDATVVWLVALLTPIALTPSIYALFVLVAAEASVRFAPLKGSLASTALIAGLAFAIAIRTLADESPFDLRQLLFWAALIVLIGTVVGTAVREVYRQRTVPGTALDPELMQALTRRERQVLALIIQGYSNSRIAEALFIERKTVKNHINSIYSKLHLNSRYEAITRALSQRGREEETSVNKEETYA